MQYDGNNFEDSLVFSTDLYKKSLEDPDQSYHYSIRCSRPRELRSATQDPNTFYLYP